ncbi:M48 family metalloprotease [Romeria aff. gracilis LEGE 07310]|uniref:M48 family metalloprotease n=2 Tax=Vasconcelosia TaxID=3366328 RepID=A0A8J7ALU2_9CYAN|nr:M48 family metalloprotease [Romeria aff. gracilis LEGE 07310]
MRFITPGKIYRRFLYGLMAFVMTIGIGMATPQPSHAGIFDLIFNGIRVYQLSNISDRQEVQLGGQINQQLLNSGEFRLYNNDAVTSYVNSVGQRLVPASDRPNLPYRFQVVNDDAVNAFATMGGYVYVTTGLIQAASDEAELASVLGHEIGHIAGKHALKQMRQVAIAQGITGALGVNRDRLVNIGVQVALQLPASREDEYEADQHGFETLGRAGYAQSAMVSFMQKLVRRGSPPEFLSTHPNAQNRVERLQTMLNESAIAEADDGLSESAYTANIQPLL